MKFILALNLLLIFACSNKPKAVNDTAHWPLAPFTTPESTQEVLHRPAESAISGQLLLKSQISSILPNTRLNLYRLDGQVWKLVSEFNTDIDGRFAVTQKLFPGRYELRSAHSKYVGVLPVLLNDKAENDLIFEVTLKK